ncbi:MAG: hypothetical protein ACM3MG_00810 [Bacillota bacterium]
MFKIVSYVLAYFFGSASKSIDLKEMAFEILEEAVYRSRKTVALLLAGLSSTILACGGFLIALTNASNQYDNTGHIYATATLWSGIAITLFFLGATYYIFAIAWPGVHTHHSQTRASTTQSRFQSTQHPSELERAVSLLIMDFIEGRKLRREERRHDKANREARWEENLAKKSPPSPSASGPH